MSGLELLNKRVPHRFTIIYRFDGEAFFAIAVVDKLKEASPALFSRVPFEDSFCRFTVTAGQFLTAASMDDRRLDGHLHQANVQSYIGLPLTCPNGDLYGTFCHVDFVPQAIDDSEFSFMQVAGRHLAGHLQPFLTRNQGSATVT